VYCQNAAGTGPDFDEQNVEVIASSAEQRPGGWTQEGEATLDFRVNAVRE
jgi:hypothetical protein